MSAYDRALAASFATALTTTGLAAGAALAHVLEAPNKRALPPDLYVPVQQRLYQGWGLAMGGLEFTALAGSLAASVLARGPARVGALVASAGLAAELGVWASVVAPVNAEAALWRGEVPPDDLAARRDQWDRGHAARFVLITGSLAALAVGVTRR